MWLSSSSVGRKFIMALTGAFLVLFVTFHCLMNSVAILWPAAYNSVCEFLGANWYALVGTAVIAVFVILHICYAVMLTVQNRAARGNDRYSISRRPKNVEWSSQNMFVLGIVILAFLVVHLIQFWAKMQLMEVLGNHGSIPGAAGTLFLQEAFSQIWTPIVYIIGFIALWFHMNHGFWSMFQSVGWDSTVWIPRLKKIACWWSSIVVLLFIAQAVTFTVRASENYYKTDECLREQYKDMLVPMVEKEFGAEGAQLAMSIEMGSYEQVSQGMRQMNQGLEMQLQQLQTPEGQAMIKAQPNGQELVENMKKQQKAIQNAVGLFDYLEEGQNTDNTPAQIPNM